MSTGTTAGSVRVIDKLSGEEAKVNGVALLTLIKHQLGFVNVAASCALCEHWRRRPSVVNEGHCQVVPGLSFATTDISCCNKFKARADVQQHTKIDTKLLRLMAEFKVAAEFNDISETLVNDVLATTATLYPEKLAQFVNKLTTTSSENNGTANEVGEKSENQSSSEVQESTNNGAAEGDSGTA
jgi:hypothetical protein